MIKALYSATLADRNLVGWNVATHWAFTSPSWGFVTFFFAAEMLDLFRD